jgi:hypothetical protein
VDARATAMVGLAPHSGWAAAVVLAGSAAAPRVVLRERLELAAADLAGARQPYHALAGLPPEEAERRLEHYSAAAGRLALSALGGLIERSRTAGVEPAGAGILAATGRSGATLAAILASHALIHTADGQHFRAALARACASLGLAVTQLPQRLLAAEAAGPLRRAPGELAAALRALGRGIGPPWGADQKNAALLAWLLLARAA